MSEAKVRLSQKEMELVSKADLILTKNAILQKVNQLLAGIQVKQQQFLISYPATLPVEVINSSPKISKGENYKGLPYSILDHPRYFEKENILAIRTLFWWGNFFSVTLHLSGIQKKNAGEKLSRSYELLRESGYYFYQKDDPWEHHFEAGNYIPLTEISVTEFENLIREKTFIKLVATIPIQQWDKAEEMLLGYFKQIIGMLAD